MSDRGSRSWLWLPGVIFVGAAALRATGLWTELWMDEILSIRLVEAVDSPLRVFTDIHSDNNHYLNSLWLWTAGPGAPAWLMRLPPLVLGVTLVALAWRVARPRAGEAAITATLFAVSYPLIHYSSEARGYGYLLFLSLFAFHAFRGWTGGGGRWTGAAYALAASLAFLAHIGFVTVFAAFLLWSTLEIRGGESRPREAARHAVVHLLPSLTFAALFLVDVRFMEAAGGFARLGPLESLVGGAGLVVGVAPGPVPIAVAACAWAAIVLAVRRSYRDDSRETVFLVAAMLLAFVAGAVPGYGYPRYYLTALVFSLILLGRWIAASLASKNRSVAGIVLLLAFAAVNLGQTLQFASVGRGMYLEAAAYMAAETDTGPVTVTGSHDMGSVLALGYYGPRLPGEAAFTYLCHSLSTPGCSAVRPSPGSAADPPRFYLLSSLENGFAAPPTLDVPDLARYGFVRSFPKYGLSGVYWALYELPGRPAAP